MVYTKEKLQEMSDFEITYRLAGLIYGYPWDKDISRMVHNRKIDFCNNPSDIMPLAFERFINLHHSGIDWIAFNEDKQFIHTNPLRAIACLILMMED